MTSGPGVLAAPVSGPSSARLPSCSSGSWRSDRPCATATTPRSPSPAPPSTATGEAAPETKVAPAETLANATGGAVPDHSTPTNDPAQSAGGAATETTTAPTGSTVAQGALPVPAVGPISPAASATAGDDATQSATPLVALATIDDLRRLVADHEQVDASALAAPCAGRFGPALADVTWRGVPAVVVVQPSTSAPTRAVVVDADCGVLASVDLP